MKVCMLVTNSIKKDPRVRREAESAVENPDTEVVVIGCNDVNYDEKFLSRLNYKTRIYPLPVKYKQKLVSRIDKFKRMVYPTIGMYRICVEERPDVIHANDFDTLAAAVWAARKVKARVIYDSHEIYTEQPALSKYRIIKKALKVIESILIKKVTAVVSVSHAAAAELKKMYKIVLPTVVTNCSVYHEENTLLKKNSTFEIVYHGIVNENRGYEEFAEAAKYTNTEVTFVIRGYGNLIEDLKHRKEINHMDNFRIDDPVEIPELIPYASKSMVGAVLTKPVSANYKYTVSNKIFEYVQARIPVIMSDVPEHRYLNEKYHLGIIVDEVTAEKIAEAANKFYEDKEFYQTCLENVRRAAKELCWENEFRKLYLLYCGQENIETIC